MYLLEIIEVLASIFPVINDSRYQFEKVRIIGFGN